MLLVVVLVALTPAGADHSKQCVEFDDPASLFEQSAVVFVGIALGVKPTGLHGEHVMSHRATFRVERIWKGELQRQYLVDADGAFAVDKRYIVFAGGSPLSTTLQCKWSELEAEARHKREWLAAKPSQRPR